MDLLRGSRASRTTAPSRPTSTQCAASCRAAPCSSTAAMIAAQSWAAGDRAADTGADPDPVAAADPAAELDAGGREPDAGAIVLAAGPDGAPLETAAGPGEPPDGKRRDPLSAAAGPPWTACGTAPAPACG